jgi:hypothetical protein
MDYAQCDDNCQYVLSSQLVSHYHPVIITLCLHQFHEFKTDQAVHTGYQNHCHRRLIHPQVSHHVTL